MVNHLVEKFIKLKNGEVLDIGTGFGQNAIYLAKRGCIVTTIDISKENITNIKGIVCKTDLKIKPRLLDIRKFEWDDNKYDVVLAINSLQFLKKSELIKAIGKIQKSLKYGGLAILVLFNKNDPSYKLFKANSKEIEPDTFLAKSPLVYRTFLKKNKLKSLFRDFNIIFYKDLVIKDKPHQNVPYPHYHGLSQIVAKKKKSV